MTTTTNAGRPLEAGIRDQISANFGYDFSAVRVHTGPDAHRAAADMGALAYTVGNDVVFSQGSYDPLGATGRSLIAHELAHVAQHGGTPHAASPLLAVGHSVPAAESRFERQAHDAARYSTIGLPRAWSWERSTRPFVGKAGVSWTDLPTPYPVTHSDGTVRTIARENTDGSAPNTLRVDIGDLPIPPEKGPWQAEYNALAVRGELQAMVNVQSNPSAGLWQKRAPSDELRRLWLLRVGWPSARANDWWNEAGGDPVSGEFRPRAQGVQSQIDHVVELQLGGTNVPENLAPHDGPDNMQSGREIFQVVSGWAMAVKRAVAPRFPQLSTVILSFSSASQAGNYAKPVDPLPWTADLSGRKGTALSSLQVHFTALADAQAGRRPSSSDRAAAEAARGPTTPLPLIAGPSNATLLLPSGTADVPIETSEIPENYPIRELISGISLEKLKRRTSPKTIVGWIDSPTHPARAGTRLPISVPAAADKELRFAVAEDGHLSLVGGSKNVRFTYPYLSAGQLSLSEGANGLEGTGTLTPSIPLLSRAVINVHLGNGILEGSVTADPTKLALPPFRITEAAVNVALSPALAANGHIGFELGSIVSGDLNANVDANGFFATGDVHAHIRGLDDASGHVEYRPATGLTGFVVVSASSATGVIRGGSVRVEFAHGTWTATGNVNLALPGGNTADLAVAKVGNGVVYSGHAHLLVPGLHPVDVDISYDGEHINGSAHTTFTVLGANGDITLHYHDGQFSGDGHAELRRGNFAGTLDAHLDEHGRISGRGSGSVTIRPGLVGTAGVELTPDQHLHVTGELRFPPYRFLDRHGGHYPLFHRTLPPIPIFAIPLPPPLGSVGIVATIGGGLDADYYVGPGEIRDMIITAAFDPLADNADLDLQAGARLVIPAHAGLDLSARLGIGLSVAVATATGGITVTGGVGLDGGLDASVTIHYHAGVLVLDANAGIRVQPVLTLGLDADFSIESPLHDWHWPYHLADYRYDTGLMFGMNIPLHYATNEDFRMPAISDIQWVIPDIDVSAMASSIGDRVASGLGF